MMTTSFTSLPADLPVPVDDGGAAHLVGLRMPAVHLVSTQGSWVDFAALPPGRAALFIYPMTGRPGVPLPDGWDEIPGARGCTPQACGFRDMHRDFLDLGVSVFGLSTQTTDYQREMVERLHVPYAVLSDADFLLTDRLKLPTFEVYGVRLLRRLTLVLRDGMIEHVFYPVFPSDRSAADTLDWLRTN